jgi:hypothetical protein
LRDQQGTAIMRPSMPSRKSAILVAFLAECACSPATAGPSPTQAALPSREVHEQQPQRELSIGEDLISVEVAGTGNDLVFHFRRCPGLEDGSQLHDLSVRSDRGPACELNWRQGRGDIAGVWRYGTVTKDYGLVGCGPLAVGVRYRVDVSNGDGPGLCYFILGEGGVALPAPGQPACDGQCPR